MTEFTCEICEKVFSTKIKLRAHFNYNHDNIIVKKYSTIAMFVQKNFNLKQS